jgi:ATP-dependent Clp protease ATP-binding subunit ClpC
MGTVAQLSFNPLSMRSSKARLAVAFSPALRRLLQAVMLLLVIGGVFLLFYIPHLGWFVLAAGTALGLVQAWADGELAHIPPADDSIDGLLDSALLGKLSHNPSPREIAQKVMLLPGGQFYAVRFGIGPSFLTQLTSENPGDTQRVWQDALQIRDFFHEEELSAATVTAALVRTIPNVETFLAQLQLSSEDVLKGAQWYGHIGELVKKHSKKQRTGGIARDFTFGYTPMLSRFGVNISNQVAYHGVLAVDLEGHTEALNQLITFLGGGGRPNAALVGPLGAGKTTVVHAFAEQILQADASVPPKLKFRQVISLDASTLISQAGGRGELEKLVNELLSEAYRAKNIILCLDDAQLFFEDGVGSVNLSNVLLPVLEGGAIPLILGMDEQRWLQIAQRNPALVAALNRVSVAESNQDDTLRVMQDQIIVLEYRHKVAFMYQGLLEAYRLALRYMHDQAMPGKAIRLLETAAGHAENGLVTARSVQKSIETTMDVKVGTANTSDERDTLLNLENLIHQRMINQSRAVQVVSDALRRARTGVRNPDRPVGTFLFLGPTGVGKTELAKSIAAVYFGGEERLIRIDLNEYVQSTDVARLIADGATDPFSMAAQAAKQPFSVVLLDEIEKAHPDVLNTLLQVLDEGILRDINNRQISFRDAIIVATSNAGADRVRELISGGQQLEQFEEQFVNELIDSHQFRPEFLNRFDEIVVFRPLKQEELVQVVDLIIAGINKNLSLQKVSVVVAEDAKKALVAAGYDARLGARPMRRIVQRTVENIIAKRMLAGSVPPGSTIQINMEDIQATGVMNESRI